METQSDYYEKIICFINKNDIFWMMDLRDHLQCNSSESTCIKNVSITHVIRILKEKQVLQCCENKGSQKQYMLLKKASIKQLYKPKKLKKT